MQLRSLDVSQDGVYLFEELAIFNDRQPLGTKETKNEEKNSKLELKVISSVDALKGDLECKGKSFCK